MDLSHTQSDLSVFKPKMEVTIPVRRVVLGISDRIDAQSHFWKLKSTAQTMTL